MSKPKEQIQGELDRTDVATNPVSSKASGQSSGDSSEEPTPEANNLEAKSNKNESDTKDDPDVKLAKALCEKDICKESLEIAVAKYPKYEGFLLKLKTPDGSKKKQKSGRTLLGKRRKVRI